MDQPPVNDISFKHFLEKDKLMGSRCRNCGTRFVPPRPLCIDCNGREMEWVDIEGAGRLAAFTCISIAPPAMAARGFGRNNPYISGVVELRGGGRVDARIVGVDPLKPENIKVGMPLSATFLREKDGDKVRTSLAFQPVDRI
jgi:uncharacterized OB-fold protein